MADHPIRFTAEIDAATEDDLVDRLNDLATEIARGNLRVKCVFAGRDSKGFYEVTDPTPSGRPS